MKVQPPHLEKRKDGWYVVLNHLTSRYTIGPIRTKKSPMVEMKTWDPPRVRS